jgi:Flp pilus assembly pilin Flp
LTHPIPSLRSRARDEGGQTIVEYALVLGTVSLVLIGAFVVIGLADEFEALVNSIFAD